MKKKKIPIHHTKSFTTMIFDHQETFVTNKNSTIPYILNPNRYKFSI